MEFFLFIFIALVFLSILISVFAVKIYQELERAKRNLHKYKHLISQEEYQKELTLDIESKRRQISQFKDEENQLNESVELLSKKLTELKDEEFVESFGFYQPKYDFISSGSYESLLKKNRDKQRKMIKAKTAAICHSSWSVSGSEKAGERMTENFRKLVLNVFNNECDTLISRLKCSSNVNSVETKIEKHFNKLNKLCKIIHCEITEEYLELKRKQLHLQYQREIERYEDLEREKAIKAEAKDRKKLEKIMRQAEEAEERENSFQQELENTLKEQKMSYGVEKEKLELQIQRLRQDIENAKNEKDKANAQAALTKAGYIYVVSNIGSLGRNIYRIWMTKSSEPDKTIDAMSRTVPFPFDVHLKFFSEEASDTMSQLKEVFSGKRVNKANERRDFFNASLDEILQSVKDIKEDTGIIKSIYVEKTPSAYEYRRTQAIERGNDQQPQRHNTETVSNETA